MRRDRWLTGILTGGFLGALAGCRSNGAAPCATGESCGALDAGEFDGTGDDGGAGEASDGGESDGDGPTTAGDASACDPSTASSCAVDESHGVFVAPPTSGGNDTTGTGARSAPVGSIGHALDLAKAAGKAVYVCAGVYDESVLLDAAHDGVSIFGGLDCTTWVYSTANFVLVLPSQPGYAIEIKNLSVGTTLSAIAFTALSAPDMSPTSSGTAWGASSVAAFVHGAQHVTLEHVALRAGAGHVGAPGVAAGPAQAGRVTGGTNWTTMSLDGVRAASDGGPVAANSCTCPLDGSHSSGGQGGGPQQTPGPGLPSYGDDAGAGGAGVNNMQCRGGGGYDGLNAPAGPADAPLRQPGTISDSGWSPSKGVSGSPGLPGQGGGGGGSGDMLDGGLGGGGACGGCGGAGGGAGGGGGGSIALLNTDSDVVLSDCVLTAAAGGTGGAGASGEPGQVGGTGGGGYGGCQGGSGGDGAGGNGGQGGAGGVSLGIAFHGTAPTVGGAPVNAAITLPSVTVSPTMAAGGPGGPKGGLAAVVVGPAWPGSDGAAGPAGASQAVMEF